MTNDFVRPSWQTVSRCYKFDDTDGSLGMMAKQGVNIDELKSCRPHSYVGCNEITGNIALDTGLQYIIEILMGNKPDAKFWNSTNSMIIIGDQDNPTSAEQTQLEAQRIGSNFQYMKMDERFPQREGNTMVFRASFQKGVAVWHWREWGVSNGDVLLNRKVESIGLKPEYELWIMEVRITWK